MAGRGQGDSLQGPGDVCPTHPFSLLSLSHSPGSQQPS